jgi:phage tail-like protein
MVSPGRQLIVWFEGHVLLTSTLGSSTFSIGRDSESTLPLLDPGVSPHHAEIIVAAGQASITDLGSEQGTFVAGLRLAANQPHPLTDGAKIRIGPYELVYRSQIDVPAADPPATALLESEAADIPTPEPDSPVPFAEPVPYGTPNGAGSSGRYLSYLPIIFHDNDFLSRFLQIFERIWEPLEHRQDFMAMYLTPRTCPASWLPWYASWFGIDVPTHLPEARIRRLLAEAIEIYRWRGTARGLAHAIEVSLGIRPEITERPSEPNVFRVSVRLPKHAGADVMAILHGLISTHKPAHTGYVIEVQR